MADKMTDTGARALAAAVILQCVKDWEALCRALQAGKIDLLPDGDVRYPCGKRKAIQSRPPVTFKEIETWMRDYGPIYTTMDIDIMLAELHARLARARSRAKSRRTTE